MISFEVNHELFETLYIQRVEEHLKLHCFIHFRLKDSK